MKREAMITVRAPAGLKSALVDRARREDRSLADEVIALIYRGLMAEPGPAPLPPDKVWKQLLQAKGLLQQRAMTPSEQAEFMDLKKKRRDGKLETLTAGQALAMLGQPLEAPAEAELTALSKLESLGAEIKAIATSLRQARGPEPAGRQGRRLAKAS